MNISGKDAVEEHAYVALEIMVPCLPKNQAEGYASVEQHAAEKVATN